MKITIVGAGSIGGALAKGLLSKNVILPADLTLTAEHQSTLDGYKSSGCNLTLDNVTAVKGADIVVLAVKPWIVAPVIGEIKDSLDYSSQTVVCLAAGMGEDALIDAFFRDGEVPGLAYAIPNTALEIGESVTFISPVRISDGALEKVVDIFAKLGKALVVPQKLLGAGTALASCGIAYAMRYARAATLGGVELGFKPAEALGIVEQTVVGAMKLMEAHGTHPETEIDKVTTPGGITIKGLNAMERAGFTNSVIEGLKAAK